jgi:hypothetical protein
MIKKITLPLCRFILFCSIFLSAKNHLQAQTVIVPQQFDGLEKLCAGNVFNEFYATFTYLNFPAGTTFALELSDATGSFSTPVATTTLAVIDLSPTQKTIKFSVPENLVGSDQYSLRVKSSTGYVSPTLFKNSLGSTSFPAYFKEYENAFFINDKIETAFICAGGSLTLSVLDEDLSPAHFSNIKYKWFKDDVLIAGESSKDLIVNSVGRYYAEIDYGQCSDVNFSSNRVTVSSSASGSAVTIDSSLGNPFCSSGSGTVLTATGGGNTYTWKKDGVVISGVTTRTYNATDSGLYTVEVNFGGCSATGSINLSNNSFEASIDVADEFTLLEGETKNVTVTDDATNPTYEWFFNGNKIAGATTDSYTVNVRGQYRVKVSQASGCVSSKEFSFMVRFENYNVTSVIPNVVNLRGDYPYWNIPQMYKTADTKLIILSSSGEIMFDDIGSNYDPEVNTFIKDFKNINPVYYYVIKGSNGEKKGSITVLR